MLAGLVLWLRDRFRDLRQVPEAERKLAEQKSAVGAKGFLSLFLYGGVCGSCDCHTNIRAARLLFPRCISLRVDVFPMLSQLSNVRCQNKNIDASCRS